MWFFTYAYYFIVFLPSLECKVHEGKFCYFGVFFIVLFRFAVQFPRVMDVAFSHIYWKKLHEMNVLSIENENKMASINFDEFADKWARNFS